MHKQVPSVNKTKQCANCNTTCEMCTVPTEEVEVLKKIKTITARGNDADRKSTRLNSSHLRASRMPSSA